MTNKYSWIDNPTVAQISEYNPDVLNECLMHLKYDNMPSVNTAFCMNKGNVDGNGNADLIEAELSTNLVLTQPGTYSVKIPTSGYYEVTIVGAGAGGVWGMDVYAIRSSASGGSGAAFSGRIYISEGTYSCTVGAGGAAAGNGGYGSAGGNSEIQGIILAGGGAAGAYATWGQHTGSAGGVLTIASAVNSSTISSNGYDGCGNYNASSEGGASLYNGYGKGGSASTTTSYPGNNGYLSLKFSGQSYINYKIGGSYPALSGTTVKGESFTINGLNSDDAAALADGTYIKYIGADGSSELLKAGLYLSPYIPSLLTIGDVALDARTEPLKAYKYNGSHWEQYDKVPLGKFTVSNGTISSYQTFSYNQNGYNRNVYSNKPQLDRYFNVSLPYTATVCGWAYVEIYCADDTGAHGVVIKANEQIILATYLKSVQGCLIPVNRGVRYTVETPEGGGRVNKFIIYPEQGGF